MKLLGLLKTSEITKGEKQNGLPTKLKRGSKARLFSSLKISNKEQIATSTVLAVFKVIPQILPELIKDTGISINDKTQFETYTEVSLNKIPENRKDRPDGLIYIKNRNEWTALVEAKVVWFNNTEAWYTNCASI